jgi:hypothetical protein
MARPHNLRGGHPFRAGTPTKPIAVRLTADELAIIDAACAGLNRAAWIRNTLIDAATKADYALATERG